jgi:hypothetical protein
MLVSVVRVACPFAEYGPAHGFQGLISVIVTCDVTTGAIGIPWNLLDRVSEGHSNDMH